MPDDIDRIIDQLAPRLLAEFRTVARKLIEEGVTLERERVVGLINNTGMRVSPRDVARMQRPRREGAAGYGAISQPVREALRVLSVDTPAGVSAADITAHFELTADGGPTERQVRAALKQLHKVGAANRVDRGRYLAADAGLRQPSGEAPDATASGLFDHAAE